MFQTQAVHKTYEALAPFDPTLEFPRRVISRIEKLRGNLQAEAVEAAADNRGQVAR